MNEGPTNTSRHAWDVWTTLHNFVQTDFYEHYTNGQCDYKGGSLGAESNWRKGSLQWLEFYLTGSSSLWLLFANRSSERDSLPAISQDIRGPETLNKPVVGECLSFQVSSGRRWAKCGEWLFKSAVSSYNKDMTTAGVLALLSFVGVGVCSQYAAFESAHSSSVYSAGASTGLLFYAFWTRGL